MESIKKQLPHTENSQLASHKQNFKSLIVNVRLSPYYTNYSFVRTNPLANYPWSHENVFVKSWLMDDEDAIILSSPTFEPALV